MNNLQSIARELRAQLNQDCEQDRRRTIRETVTIWLAVVAGIGAVASAIFLYVQLQEARDFAGTQHDDTTAALKVAKEANTSNANSASAQIKEMINQSRIMQGQVDELKREQEISQRPIVSWLPPTILRVGDYQFQIILIWKNVGHTIATNGRMSVSNQPLCRTTGEKEDPFQKCITHDGIFHVDLPPEATIQGFGRTLDAKALASNPKDVKEWVVGSFDYDDPLNPGFIRHTQFCRLIQGGPDGVWLDMCPDGRHNCADEGCKVQ